MTSPTLAIEIPVYGRLDLRVVAARGAELILDDGRRLLDFYAGHAVVLGSHSDEELARDLAEQAGRLRFQTSLIHTDERDRALTALRAFAPAGLGRAFLVNSGAEANENALRAAFLHHQRRGEPRRVIVAIEGAFHGRSAAASACTWSARKGWYGFPQAPFEVRFVPVDDVAALEAALDRDVAALIVEPIQGIAGARDLDLDFLRAARDLCHAQGALMIADEIQCGLGRSGDRFAFEAAGIVPDLATLAKGLGGGFPVGALLTSEAIAASLAIGDLGTTFGGAPLACRAIVRVLEELENGLLERVRPLSERIRARCRVGPVTEIQGRGLLLGLRVPSGARALRDALLARGILVGTSDDPEVLRLTPPYVIDEDDVDRLAAAIAEVAA
ncbi:MAG: aspartate aminotransferase family protein [Planctomycetes bacterium]|nr:aspartate aminotransferase family protein [Planctomycetota bacterium]